ncbi:MAG: penicillin acylase family protein, partial [Gemmatimonadales bacterium]
MKLATVARVAPAAALLAGGVIAGARSIGPLPPLGRFLDPVNGVWAVAANAELPKEAEREVVGLSDSVLVIYDHRRVPHIFATTEEDGARALGYVVARDRLFQLELQSRATEGTISEITGSQALPYDRSQRRLGLAWSAKRHLAGLDSTSETLRLAAAYAEGVNAWIDQLRVSDVPLEYRLLDAHPRPWKPVYTLYLMRQMGQVLAHSRQEESRERIARLVGEEAMRALFPLHSAIQEPIVPRGSGARPRFERRPIPPPHLASAEPSAVSVNPADVGPVPASNSFAVAASNSASGNAILAGDPHLELTLPSVWYEAHVVVPSSGYDTYGVAFPGSPTIIIGFNRHAAWTFTNTNADVTDYYEELLDDPERPARYLLDGSWQPLEMRVETFRGPKGEPLATDTIYHTHRGPLLEWHDGRHVSMRWTMLDTTNAGAAIVAGTRATTVTSWLSVMERHGAAPQTGLVADCEGNIGIVSAGLYPVRPRDGVGTELWDGTTSRSDWLGYVDPERWPRAVNPEQGYLASANQEPVDPQTDGSFYLGANWWPPWRALRINELLRANRTVTPSDLERYQLDPGSPRADVFVQAFLEAADHLADSGHTTTDIELGAALLGGWDRRYTRENVKAVLFELAMAELKSRLWDEFGGMRPWPSETALWQLLQAPENLWWDDRATAQRVEGRDDVVGASLGAALVRARDQYGAPGGTEWRWERRRHANIY